MRARGWTSYRLARSGLSITFWPRRRKIRLSIRSARTITCARIVSFLVLKQCAHSPQELWLRITPYQRRKPLFGGSCARRDQSLCRLVRRFDWHSHNRLGSVQVQVSYFVLSLGSSLETHRVKVI